MEVPLFFVPSACGLNLVMLKQRLLHQDKVEYVYGRNVSKCLKQHQRNSTIWQRSVSSCLFTRFSQSDKSNERNLKVQPWILTWLSSVAFAFSCTGSLIVFSSVTHFFFFFVLCKWVFSFSLLFLPACSLSANSNSPMTFLRVSGSDFYATAVAAVEERGMYLPVMSGRMCVWCGCVFHFHCNRSLSYINK